VFDTYPPAKVPALSFPPSSVKNCINKDQSVKVGPRQFRVAVKTQLFEGLSVFEDGVELQKISDARPVGNRQQHAIKTLPTQEACRTTTGEAAAPDVSSRYSPAASPPAPRTGAGRPTRPCGW
jgi:hypothetical protein